MTKIHKVRGLLLLLLLANAGVLPGQTVERVDPPYWWKNHPVKHLDLLVKGGGLETFQLPENEGRVTKVTGYLDGTYAWVQLELNETFSGNALHFQLGNGTTYPFLLLERGSHRPLGLEPTDLVYLIAPDRFCNGDVANDRVEGMRETTVERSEPFARHGGDVEGMRQQLPYIASLGCTAIWPNPLLENDMAEQSYHGYAITDHYRVDPRYGTASEAKRLFASAHAQGIKHVADLVYNHWGSEHVLQRLLPDSAMVHWSAPGQFAMSSFRFTTLSDPHQSAADVADFQNGWFAGAMPDLNQQHPLTAAYLRMHALWYVEAFEVDALRLDTYAFSDESFLRTTNAALKQAYPKLFIFGETWAHSEGGQAYFAPNHLAHVAPSGLDATTDFTFWKALHQALSPPNGEEYSWEHGVNALYYRLANDLFYERPNELVTFIDNHDDGRFLGQTGGSFVKLKSALTLLYTLRGIPVLLYGTEVGMDGFENHGILRSDWPGFQSPFTPEALDSPEKRALFAFVQELGQWRKAHPKFMTAPLVQHAPNEAWGHYERSYTEQMEGGKRRHTLHVVFNGTPESRRWNGKEVEGFGSLYYVEVTEEEELERVQNETKKNEP